MPFNPFYSGDYALNDFAQPLQKYRPIDFGSITPNDGNAPEFQTFAGSGQVDSAARDFIKGIRNSPDWGAVVRSQATPDGFTIVDKNDPNPWLGGAGIFRTGTEADNAGGDEFWRTMNQMSTGNFDPNSRYFVRQDASRVEDGLYKRDYYDGAGKHAKSEILNDPNSIGAFTPGDLQMIISGLAAMGGVAALGAGMTAAGAGTVGAETAGGIGAASGDAGLMYAGADGVGGVAGLGGGATVEGVGSALGGLEGVAGAGGIIGAPVASTAGAGAVSGLGAGSAAPTSAGSGTSGGGLLSGTAFNVPGLGNVSWTDLLKFGSVLAGAAAGGQGNEQTTTSTRELPDYLKGPVAGPNGLLSSANSLMQHQLYGTPMRRMT